VVCLKPRVIYGACLRSGANLGQLAPLRPPWGSMGGCGGRPMQGPYGPNPKGRSRGATWGAVGAPWGPVRGCVGCVGDVWGTQLIVSRVLCTDFCYKVHFGVFTTFYRKTNWRHLFWPKGGGVQILGGARARWRCPGPGRRGARAPRHHTLLYSLLSRYRDTVTRDSRIARETRHNIISTDDTLLPLTYIDNPCSCTFHLERRLIIENMKVDIV
jgi:hypothetical protein